MECPALDLFDLTVLICLGCSFTEPCPVLSLYREPTRLPDDHEQMVVALPA